MNFLGFKAIVDAEKYQYETAKLHKHDDKPLTIERSYFEKLNELEKLKLIKEDTELAVLEIKKKISNLLILQSS